MQDSKPFLRYSQSDFPLLRRAQLETLQVNLGYLCNLSCVHCHVNAGPSRTELMEKENIDLIIEVLKARNIKVLDLTGGAPEMNPFFRGLVVAARALGVKVIDRCNLVILNEVGFEDLANFLAEQEVYIVASLPCYSLENVDKQRGKDAFDNSIIALKKLNQLGYGRNKKLVLDLVYNPQGPSLPPPQQALQEDYKTELKTEYDIDFDHLLTITNMPISRFGAVLLAQNQFENYMNLLKENYAPENLSGVMCRTLVSVDWQGFLYDCDFNQMLDIPVQINNNQQALHLRDLLNNDFSGEVIQVADHCYGCTAGQGSSCSGAL